MEQNFTLGEFYEDFGCMLTNYKCGENMEFHFINRLIVSNKTWHEKCIYRCSCISKEYMELDGQCLKNVGKILLLTYFTKIIKQKLLKYINV